MELVPRQGKKCGALLFSLNFLWLLSLFQDKESDNDPKMKLDVSLAVLGIFLSFACLKEKREKGNQSVIDFSPPASPVSQSFYKLR